MALLEQNVLNNSIENWLIAFAIAMLVAVVLNVSKKILVRIFIPLKGKLPGDMAQILTDMLRRTNSFLLFIISLYAGSRVLSLSPATAKFFHYLAVVSAGIQIGVWASFLITKLVLEYMIRRTGKDDVPSGIAVIQLISRVIVWVFIVLLVLDNLGFNITALVAGLGIGGIAIAMASQSILADLFASFSIILDKPFKVGDFIIVGDLLGSVEHIGLKTTRLRSLSGEQLVFSNADLLSSRIRNYKRMQERRVVFTVGIEYSTAYEHLKRIPQMIKDIVESIQHTRFDRSHFMSFGDCSLNIETVYYVLFSDYNIYADVQQEINLKLFKKFKELGIVFAFPTRTLYLTNEEKRPFQLELSKT